MNMSRQNNNTYGPLEVPKAKLESVFNGVKFGTVTLTVINGSLSPNHEPRVRYSGKPRSHLNAGKHDSTGKPQLSRAKATRDLLDYISPLTGLWEVTVQVANSIPFKWDYEEVRPLRNPTSN